MLEMVIAGLFGLLLGSFLNVCIFRLPRDLSVVRPRSHCLSCGQGIAAYDNIPVLSYLLLGGRCRRCRSSIHWRYPAVEILTAALFALGVWLWGPTAEAGKFALFAFLQLGMIFSDLETRLLPDEFTKGGIVAGLLLALVVPMKPGMSAILVPAQWSRYASFFDAALAAVLLSGVLWGVGYIYNKLRHKDGLGFGDVKMLAMIGAFQGAGTAISTLFLGCVGGTVLGLAYVYLAKKDASTYEIPFGSFLGAAALITSVWLR
jgi:leader peptidase (prepilin peptidase) / N-methyltransferase